MVNMGYGNELKIKQYITDLQISHCISDKCINGIKIYRIYKINIEEKKYIGLTGKTVTQRKEAHLQRCFTQSEKERNGLPKLYNKIRKIFTSKKEAKKFLSIEEICNTKCINCAKLIEYYLVMEQEDSFVNGLNSAPGGNYQDGINNPMFGKTLSEEHKRKIGEANKNRIVSLETKQKISKANKGKKLSNAHKEKLSKANKGNKGFWTGKKRNVKTNEKISKSLSGRKQSPETIEKRRQSLINNYKNKKRKPMSEETKRKISETLKKRNKNND